MEGGKLFAFRLSFFGIAEEKMENYQTETPEEKT
jgi:hypothetical protein